MTTLKELLLRTYENLQILQEREAKMGGAPDLNLHNAIADHHKAVELIQQALTAELTETGLKGLKEELRSLLIAGNVEQVDLDQVKLEIPPLPYEPQTLLIPAGSFLLGSPPGEDVPAYETPQHEINLPAYRIGQYPVTNEQFAEFVRQTRRLVAPETGWAGQTPPADQLKHPVMGITWHEALAYCDWLSQQTSRAYTLPSEAQWEKAARGTDGRLYPWGNDWDANRCNHGSNQITPVDAYPPQNESGCYDLVGNVREWTRSLWGEKRLEPDSNFRYPWVNDRRRDDLIAPNHIYRVYRGGAFSDKVSQLRCSARNGYAPDKPGPPYKRHGFRVVLEV
jgi:formylglycine-generating enzyme required for sulfatase activity